ncbi:hypothetical protein [Labilibaculum sp.]|uniref:hypothetical protein n=1 Tax=Labilibaculum sp. TaxID=2060723 RepID=UPI002AA840CF|nr:hypothetical protein [Labilibaculum sp.]MBN2598492.1 hypothetical protein [Marinifilaceae bacterium]
MKILAIEKEFKDVDWSNKSYILEQEAHHVHQLYISEYLREIYFNEHNNAVLIMECKSLEHAKEILDELPLVKEKLIKFKIMQLNAYTGYKRIIKKENIQ